MTTFLAGTDSVATSEKLLSYLETRVGDDDEVYAVNSLRGGDRSTDDDVLAGTEALEVLEDNIGAEGHQLIRGNSPQEDILAFADDNDVDELVIGIRKRNPTAKIVFGSTAQSVLLRSERPVAVVPLTEGV